MPENKVVPEGRPPQIQVTEPEAHQFVSLRRLILDAEGRDFGRIEDIELPGYHLHLARGNPGVLRTFGTRGNLTFDLEHPLVAEALGYVMDLGRNLRVEHHLDNALPVSKVNKYKSAVVSPAVHPARQGNLAVYIISANGSAAGGLEQSASHFRL